MSSHYANIILSNGARITVRPDYDNARRKAFRWSVFNAGQARSVARGADLYGPEGLPGLPSGRAMVCALLSFAGSYAETIAYHSEASDLHADDLALGRWYEDNESEIFEWQSANDPEFTPEDESAEDAVTRIMALPEDEQVAALIALRARMLTTCDVCGADTSHDEQAGTFTELDGAPYVCGKPECNASVLAEQE